MNYKEKYLKYKKKYINLKNNLTGSGEYSKFFDFFLIQIKNIDTSKNEYNIHLELNNIFKKYLSSLKIVINDITKKKNIKSYTENEQLFILLLQNYIEIIKISSNLDLFNKKYGKKKINNILKKRIEYEKNLISKIEKISNNIYDLFKKKFKENRQRNKSLEDSIFNACWYIEEKYPNICNNINKRLLNENDENKKNILKHIKNYCEGGKSQMLGKILPDVKILNSLPEVPTHDINIANKNQEKQKIAVQIRT